MANFVKFDRIHNYTDAISGAAGYDANTIYFTQDTREVVIGSVIYGTAVPKVKNELIYSDDNKHLTTHQLLEQEVLVVDNNVDFDKCTADIEKDILKGWRQFQCKKGASYPNAMPEYGTGVIHNRYSELNNTSEANPPAQPINNDGYGYWYTNSGAGDESTILNAINSKEFNGYMMPYAKRSYSVESIFGTKYGNTTGDHIGFTIINDSYASPRHFTTIEGNTYYRNTLYDVLTQDPTYDTVPVHPIWSAWVCEDIISHSASVIYTPGPTANGGAESFPTSSQPIAVYIIDNTRTSTNRRTKPSTVARHETPKAGTFVEGDGCVTMLNVSVTNSTGYGSSIHPTWLNTNTSTTCTGTIFMWATIYNVKTGTYRSISIIDGQHGKDSMPEYWKWGCNLVPYNSNCDGNVKAKTSKQKAFVTFDNGVLTMRFGGAIPFTQDFDQGTKGYNGSEVKMDFRSGTYTFTPYTGSDKAVAYNKPLPTVDVSGYYDKTSGNPLPSFWNAFTGETKFMYSADSYSYLYIKCEQLAIDNVVLYVDKNSSKYGVYRLNDDHTQYVIQIDEQGTPIDPTDILSGSRMSYNDITKKLFYSDGETIWQIGSNAVNELPVASSTTLGCVKLGYENTGKNYKVDIDTHGNLYVNVPWVDTTATWDDE